MEPAPAATGGATPERGENDMGKLVFAGAMSHVLDPEYYDRACGAVGKATVEACMTAIGHMGERMPPRAPTR